MAWPRTGRTTIRPRKNGIDPITRPAVDDQAPHGDRHRVGGGDAQRGDDRNRQPDVAVEEQREGHDADGEHQGGEERAHRAADDDHRPAGAGGEGVAEEGAERGRRFGAEGRVVDAVRGQHPDDEDATEHQAEHRDRGEGGMLDDLEGMGPARLLADLAPPAHLVEADSGDRAEQREPRYHREEQRHQVAVEGEPGEQDTDHRVEHAERDHVGAAGAEVLHALPQHLAQIARRAMCRMPGAARSPVSWPT